MEEFFHLPHVPPPFNSLQLLRRMSRQLAEGAPLTDQSTRRRSPLLTASDIKKKSKVAQLNLLRRQEAAAAETEGAKLSAIVRSQLECAERLEKVVASSSQAYRAASQLLAHQRHQQLPSATPTPFPMSSRRSWHP